MRKEKDLEVGTFANNEAVSVIEFGGAPGNAMSSAELANLAQEISDYSNTPKTKVVLLKSKGERAFCGGASFDEMKAAASSKDESRLIELFSGFARVILAIKDSPKLVLVQVQGKAVGGGVGLIAAADYAIATRTAEVRLSELAVGLGPFVIGPAVERKIGPGNFLNMTLDTEWRSAEWALQHGLYGKLAEDPSQLEILVREKAQFFASCSADAVRKIKESSWEGFPDFREKLLERAKLSAGLAAKIDWGNK